MRFRILNKNPTLQQGFEIICKNLADFEAEQIKA
jgi:hypothetical protein